MTGRTLNYIVITVILFIFWIAISGSFDWPQLLFGLVTAVFVTYFNRNLLVEPSERPSVSLKSVYWFFIFFIQLLLAIVVANFQVAWLVLHPKMPIEPNMLELDTEFNRPVSRFMLANSITLTPGTLTVLADDNCYLVHALTRASGEELHNWSLIELIKKMEDE